ncbi:MAG: T9SS type A sorting domain-containing protein [Bacteroidetes bacterium]|nr:T9SS type A sorting domain-containing protein [Bacteroidota bacterium]
MKHLLNSIKGRGRKLFISIPTLFSVLSLAAFQQADAQVTLSLQLSEQNGLTSIQAGGEYHIQLNYSVSSTTSYLTGLKAVVNLPANITNVQDFIGTSDAPASGFVYNASTHTLTISFNSPLASGSNGALVFGVLTTNLTTPNNTILTSTATLSDANGNSTGPKTQSITVNASANICAQESFVGGGAINNPTTYQFAINYGDGVYAPLGTLEATNIVFNDTLAPGATFIGATVTSPSTGGGPVSYTLTNNNGVISISLPNMDYNSAWSDVNTYNVQITVQYNSPTFSVGQVVTNNASVNYTAYGMSASVLSDGQSVNGSCTAVLSLATTLATPSINATISKTPAWGSNLTVYPGEDFAYSINYQNTSNVPLYNVSIVDMIPSSMRIDTAAEYGGIRIDAWSSIVDHGEYQTNLQSNWVVLPSSSYSNFPILGAGEYYTAIKLVLINPVPPNIGFTGYNLLHFVAAPGTLSGPLPVSNCIAWTSSTSGIPDTSARTSCDGSFTLEPRPTTSKIIYDASATPDCSVGLVSVGSPASFTALVSADPGYSDATDPICAIFVPHGFLYSSYSFNAGTSGITANPILQDSVSNYIVLGGVNYDMYRFTFPSGTILPYGTNMSITVSTTIGASLIGDFQYIGLVVASAGNASVNVPANPGGSFQDTQDWNMNGNSTEYFSYAGSNDNSCYITVAAAASMNAVQWIKGSFDVNYSQYPQYGNSYPGGSANYKLIVKNTGNIPMQQVKVVDIFPWVGDIGVIDPSARNSEWRPNLTSTISAPAGINVYYSTSTNPCRDASTLSIPSGCQDWSLTPPADITTVQSIMIDFNSTVLNGGDSLIFNWQMGVPLTAPTNNSIAWNSFAFTGVRTDNSQALLPAEPIKVGVLLAPQMLPIDWISFDAAREKGQVSLDWIIGSASNVKGFYVLRSTDNVHWENIGFVSYATGRTTYNFIDLKPSLGVTNYRIIEQDLDGKTSNSEIKTVQAEQSSDISVWPNPVTDFIHVQVNANYTNTYSEIYDVLGKKVATTVLQTGNNSIDMSHFPAGNYFIRVWNSNGILFSQNILKK